MLASETSQTMGRRGSSTSSRRMPVDTARERKVASMRRLALGPLTLMNPCRKKPVGSDNSNEGSSRRSSSSPRVLEYLRKSPSSSTVAHNKTASRNVMQFLTDACPTDIIPKILAYLGPQQTAVLSRVNRHFHTLLQSEGTWKVLCEELYKWKPGQDVPSSWKEYYCHHPCVPVDYSSIEAALTCATQDLKNCADGSSPYITVYLRPGRYNMEKAITIQVPCHTHRIIIETMQLPEACRYMEESKKVREPRATLVSHTRLRNEPLFRVTRGELFLRKISLEHRSNGNDIWNGNAALHIQPKDVVLGRAMATLVSCEIVSYSGRGIVAVDRGHVEVCDSYIHNCAATGLYIAGSCAVLHGSDVAGNGMGNQRSRGIARGHSGIYMERGSVEISNCNISHNAAAGISVVSQFDTQLSLRHSDILSNGCTPLHLPRNGSVERNNNNRISFAGAPRTRSSVLLQMERFENDL